MTNYHIPPNEHDMDELYVVLSKDNNGEGIVSMMTPMGGMPMVFGHKRMIDAAIEVVTQMAKDTGKTMRICKFKKSEILQEISGSH